MPKFNYVVLDAKGEEITGSLDADSEVEAATQLRESGYYPTQIVQEGMGQISATAPKKGGLFGGSKGKASARGSSILSPGKVKSKSLMIFTRQLATLIDSGLPLLRGLNVLAKQEPNPILKKAVTSLADSVQTGSTFSESLAQHPKIFNKLYINMVKAGELGGVLELVLLRLAEYQEKAQKLKNKIISAMVYPVIVLVIAMAIMVFLLVYIVPKFEKIFKDMLGANAQLPALTRFVVGISGWVKENILWLLIGFIVLIVGHRLIAATKRGRHAIDSFKLRMPLFGDVLRKSAISRFSRTLGTLVTSGVPILQALNITRDTAGNVVISDAIARIHDSVKEGESIVQPLEASKVFPPMVISMVDVGEETGQLPEMLLKVADVYDDEVDNSVSALTSMLEPIMIVFLAVVVGTIVLALFLPLISIISRIGGSS